MKRDTVQILAVGLLPWPVVWLGSYVLHSAVASFLFYHAVCLTVWAVYRRRRGAFQARAVPARNWLAIVVVAVAAIGGTCFVAGRLGWLIDPIRIHAALAQQHLGTSPFDFGLLSLYFGLVNPIAEELFWRRTVYLRLRDGRIATPAALLVSSLLFGSWHWLVVRLFFPAGWAILLTLGIAIAGALFATVFERTRSVLFTILLHALAADIPILLVLWLGVLSKH